MDAKREVINEKFKNEDLVRDMKEINRLAKKAEIEKKLVATAADREIDQAKVHKIHFRYCTIYFLFEAI